jgi:hypothetical protein
MLLFLCKDPMLIAGGTINSMGIQTQSRLRDFLINLSVTVEESEKAVPPRVAEPQDIALFFAPAQAACSPCGEPVTTLSTCTRIDTKTNPTFDSEKKLDAAIDQDLQGLEFDMRFLAEEVSR